MEHQLLLFLSLVLVFVPNTSPSLVRADPSVAKPGCSESCGGVAIPFPYGIGPSCFLNDWYEIDCRNVSSSNSSKPFLKKIDSEVLNISLPNIFSLDLGGTIRVIIPAVSNANCSDRGDLPFSLEGSSFIFSQGKNLFTAVGCNVLALLNSSASGLFGCKSGCGPVNFSRDGSCPRGSSCCQTPLLSNQQDFNVEFEEGTGGQCAYAFLADQSWVASKYSDLYSLGAGPLYAPVVLEWGIPYGSDPVPGSNNRSCAPSRFAPGYSKMPIYQCYCYGGYHGNGYLESGCEDIDECVDPPFNRSLCPSHLQCVNEPGGYRCVNHWFVLIGFVSTLGALLLLLCILRLCKFIKKRKAVMLRKKYYERNGGLLLQQQIKSPEGGGLEGSRIFTIKELEVATDNFNQSRVLGHGGQGTVYKGMLTDGRIVAIKKSMVVDEEKLEQFINEVVILSKINHRNIVKLLGCCLETKVPLLVYEFIPNGTLFKYLQDPHDGLPVTWEMRLRISVEISGALSYLHSAASIPIYHRDIKSTNILLDEKYRAKVADFGTSKSVSLEQTHVTTLVQGTFGYLDPEYFQSSQFTDKSDVYSFGVVLVELLTGQKPISSARAEEGRSLVTYFIMSMEENLLFDILHPQVKEQGTEEEISRVALLARRCLHLHGRNRPTMKEVTAELEEVRNMKFPSGILGAQENDGFTKEQHADCLVPGGSSLDSMTLTSPDELPLMVTTSW